MAGEYTTALCSIYNLLYDNNNNIQVSSPRVIYIESSKWSEMNAMFEHMQQERAWYNALKHKQHMDRRICDANG